MNTHQPTSSAINGVEFSFLTTSDIKSLSVGIPMYELHVRHTLTSYTHI
jgi:hypothetical protein